MLKARPGFTLLEMLVAVTIFSGIVILALGTFARSISSSAKVAVQREKTEALRSVVDQISSDLRYTYNGNVAISGGAVPYTIANGVYQRNTNELELIIQYPGATTAQLVHRLYRYEQNQVSYNGQTVTRISLYLREARACNAASGCSDISAAAESDLVSSKYSLIELSPSLSFQITPKSSAVTGLVKIKMAIKPTEATNVTTLASCSTATVGVCYNLETAVVSGGY